MNDYDDVLDRMMLVGLARAAAAHLRAAPRVFFPRLDRNLRLVVEHDDIIYLNGVPTFTSAAEERVLAAVRADRETLRLRTLGNLVLLDDDGHPVTVH